MKFKNKYQNFSEKKGKKIQKNQVEESEIKKR